MRTDESGAQTSGPVSSILTALAERCSWQFGDPAESFSIGVLPIVLSEVWIAESLLEACHTEPESARRTLFAANEVGDANRLCQTPEALMKSAASINPAFIQGPIVMIGVALPCDTVPEERESCVIG